VRYFRSEMVSSFRKALERALTQKPFGRDVPIFHVGYENRIDPRRLRLTDGFG
jgi:hypothetical protein